MKIVFIGSEATPFAKSGGLADVLGALPKALAVLGHDIRVVLPKHNVVKAYYDEWLEDHGHTRVKIHDKREYAGFQSMTRDGVTWYFVDNEYYFGYRENLYGDFDDGERYGFFNHAALALVDALCPDADVLHLNDWQTGLIPFILDETDMYPSLSNVPTLFTIHNIAYQGAFDKALFPYLNIPYDDALEYDNQINFLKTGIVKSDHLSTVSPSYAEELTYAYFGYGMEGLLQERSDRLKGILNGIDYSVFNPEADPHIAENYSTYNHVKGKNANKEALLNMFYLEPLDKPLICVVSRLTEQKGFNLLRVALEFFLEREEFQFIVLGSGDEDIKGYFEYLRRKHPHLIGLYFGQSDKIARQIYAGADFLLMPSKYEPCGLAQLIALRYGAVPIVRQTGGLRDTITPYNKYSGEGNGFGFLNFDGQDLRHAIREALDTYQNTRAFRRLRRRGMKQDFSWSHSAKAYASLYEDMIGGR